MHTNLHDVGGVVIPDIVKAWIARVKHDWNTNIVIRYNPNTQRLHYCWTTNVPRIWESVPKLNESYERERDSFTQYRDEYRPDMNEVIYG